MKVVLGTLKDKGEDLAAFLETRVGAKPELSGDSIEFDDEGVREGVKPRDVKTYIKRFLYMKGVRKNYRVFVAGRELTVQEIERGEEKEEEKKPKAPEKEEKEEEPVEEEKGTEEPEEKSEAVAPESEAPAEPEKEVKKPRKAAARKPRAKKKAAD